MKLHGLILIAAAVTLAGCRHDFDRTLTIQQVMNEVVDPPWAVLRQSSGTIDDEKGTRDLTPTTPQSWAQANNAAAELVEAGNVLREPGRSQGADWDKAAAKMSEVALKLRAAVQAKRSQAMFDLTGDLYTSCTDCHQEYQIPFMQKRGAYPKG